MSIPKNVVDVRQITIDDIDSFAAVKRSKSSVVVKPYYEIKIKDGIKRIIGENGEFQDWGGEKNDLHTTRIIINGKRTTTAIALKGQGTRGPLTPKKMGKNGDQIQRLFQSSADAFLIQYHGQIEESVIEQMKSFAIMKSTLENRRICYGVIDAQDTARLVAAYPKEFS